GSPKRPRELSPSPAVGLKPAAMLVSPLKWVSPVGVFTPRVNVTGLLQTPPLMPPTSGKLLLMPLSFWSTSSLKVGWLLYQPANGPCPVGNGPAPSGSNES